MDSGAVPAPSKRGACQGSRSISGMERGGYRLLFLSKIPFSPGGGVRRRWWDRSPSEHCGLGRVPGIRARRGTKAIGLMDLAVLIPHPPPPRPGTLCDRLLSALIASGGVSWAIFQKQEMFVAFLFSGKFFGSVCWPISGLRLRGESGEMQRDYFEPQFLPL